MHQSYASNWEDLTQIATLFEVASSLRLTEILSWLIAISHIV